MSRYWLHPRTMFSREQIVHFAKYGSVGLSGVVINLLLFWLLSQVIEVDPRFATAFAFLGSGQVVFWGHALVTWRDTHGRKLLWTYGAFLVGQVIGVSINFTFFTIASELGAMKLVAWIAGMAVSVPFTYNFNKHLVFPTERTRREVIVRLWQKLVERNGSN